MSEANTGLERVSIKAVPARTKEAIARLARRRGQTQGEWLADLVDKGEAIQSGDLVEPGLFDPPEPPAAQAAAVVPAHSILLGSAELAHLFDLAARSDNRNAKRLATGLLVDYLKLARAGLRADGLGSRILALPRA